jgi:hypothetical protein
MNESHSSAAISCPITRAKEATHSLNGPTLNRGPRHNSTLQEFPHLQRVSSWRSCIARVVRSASPAWGSRRSSFCAGLGFVCSARG